MPRALDAPLVKLALCQRPAEMRAGLIERVDLAVLARQQDLAIADIDSPQLAFGQLRICQRRRKLQRCPDWIGVTDADLITIHQIAAEISCNDYQRIAGEGTDPARPAPLVAEPHQ